MIRKLFLLLFFSGGTCLHAQFTANPFEIGVSGGILVYQGDLTPWQTGSWKTMRPGLQAKIARWRSPQWQWRFQLLAGSLRGDESRYETPAYHRQRNFRFRTPLVELSLTAAWFPLNRKLPDKGWTPYLFAGGGFSYLRIRRDADRVDPRLIEAEPDLPLRINEDFKQTPPRFIPVIPAGIGIRYGLNETWSLQLESAYRFTFTDYLDGFSVAANPDHHDHYHTTQLGITKRLGVKNRLGCPVVMRY